MAEEYQILNGGIVQQLPSVIASEAWQSHPCSTPPRLLRGSAPRNDKISSLKQKEAKMKVVTLCKEGSCCPVVKITDTRGEIGEKGNLCTLTREQWETLKEKVLSKEL